jgi:hypothetical protein
MATMSTREKARLNLLVATVNAAIERKLITLQCEPVASAKFGFELGDHPIISWVADAGFDEVMLHTIACPTELGRDRARSIRHKGGLLAGGQLRSRKPC